MSYNEVTLEADVKRVIRIYTEIYKKLDWNVRFDPIKFDGSSFQKWVQSFYDNINKLDKKNSQIRSERFITQLVFIRDNLDQVHSDCLYASRHTTEFVGTLLRLKPHILELERYTMLLYIYVVNSSESEFNQEVVKMSFPYLRHEDRGHIKLACPWHAIASLTDLLAQQI